MEDETEVHKGLTHNGPFHPAWLLFSAAKAMENCANFWLQMLASVDKCGFVAHANRADQRSYADTS